MSRNIEIFTAMLRHLGRKEFEQCKRYLAPDLYSDWPYQPAPGTPTELKGRDALMDYIEKGTADFEPFNYGIDRIYELADPDQLIVEYHSSTHYRPANRPYGNRYLGIFHFRDGLITYWREYVNPEVIRQAMLEDEQRKKS